MVRTLVRSHLIRRGDIYYFRYTLPDHIQGLCSNLPTEIKRSLRTDSYSAALALVCAKLPLIKLIRDCKHKPSIVKLFNDIADFSREPVVVSGSIDTNIAEEKSIAIPKLSEAWGGFSKWKLWTDKQGKANQRIFDNLIFFLGDVPVDKVTKAQIKDRD